MSVNEYWAHVMEIERRDAALAAAKKLAPAVHWTLFAEFLLPN